MNAGVPANWPVDPARSKPYWTRCNVLIINLCCFYYRLRVRRSIFASLVAGIVRYRISFRQLAPMSKDSRRS